MNIFEVFAKLTLDTSEYDDGIKDAGKKASVFSDVLSANLVTKGIGVAIDGLKKLGETAVNVFKDSIKSYGDYEQLTGGIETLYKNSANKMINYANKAFKTAGLSANEYMEVAIESSAAMINSLAGDTEKAAELTNMAIIDMSDNVNKMGTNMEALQNAYRGFSRGNFTMLDNLALGFSGTKEGMQELLDKAKELSGVEYDIESYADIVEAIHVVQTEIGITGTTAEEAENTITGSVGAMKSAWQNLVRGIADGNADLDKLLDDLVKAAENAWDKFEPIAKTALNNMIDLLFKAVPKFAELGLKIGGAILQGLLSVLLKPFEWIIKLLVGSPYENALKESERKLQQAMEESKNISSRRANGGSALQNRPYIVGELGPELVVPSTTSNVYSASETRSMLGSSGTTIVIQGDVFDDERSMRGKLRTAILDVLNEQVAYG